MLYDNQDSVTNGLLVIALISTIISCVISFALIINHQIVMQKYISLNEMNIFNIQSKIVGIIWMIPIYSITSFLGLLYPMHITMYIDMLRDCYEAYVLYLFLSLLFSYLCLDREDEYALIVYLERQHSHLLKKYSWNRGKSFLRYCKFGTLQYCMIRPLSAVTAIVLDWMRLYHESEFNARYGYVYIVAIMNCSVIYSFMALATFYSVFKSKLKPFHPVSKFLCIKFILFFIFWQSFGILFMVKIGWIDDDSFIFNGHKLSAKEVAVKLQDLLICIEMVFASIAFTYAFSFSSFKDQSFQYVLSYGGDYNGERVDEEEETWATAGVVDDVSSKVEYNFEQDAIKRLLIEQIHEHPLYQYKTKTIPHLPSSHYMNTKGFEVSKLLGSNDQIKDNIANDYELIDLPYADNLRSKKLNDVLNKYSTVQDISDSSSSDTIMITDSKVSAHGITLTSSQNKKIIKNPPDILKTPIISRKQHDQQQQLLRNNMNQKLPQSLNTLTTSTGAVEIGLLDRHFSLSNTIRDFNETMPVVLPTGFEMKKGLVIRSDPSSRL